MKFGLGENKVRVKGLEPPCREALDPKSSVSTNFTTPAGESKYKQDNLIATRGFINFTTKMDKVKEYIEKNKNKFLDELFELLKIPSISAKSEHNKDILSCAKLLKLSLIHI